MPPTNKRNRPLSECIDGPAFAAAHRRVTEGKTEEGAFCTVMTRILVDELCLAGIKEVINNEEDVRLKIRRALENIRHHQERKWWSVMNNRMALKIALEHELAARATQSEFSENAQGLNEKLSQPPPALQPNPFGVGKIGRPTARFYAIVPPADDPRKPE